jgi:Zn-dependent protease/CBS domain-containing protein
MSLTSIQIGKVLGIPIRLHITFLLILPIFAWIFASNPQPFGFADVASVSLRYALSLSTAVLLFTCVLVHELGHSYVALKHGSKIQSITLFLFGGVSSMEEIPRNPKVEFRMAAAGPFVSLLIGAVLLTIYALFKPVSLPSNPYLRLIWLVGYINITLFLFNIIPAFPMDGGRLLRSWLVGRMPYIRATQAAAGIGKMFAILMGIFGFLTAAIGGFWFILIAFFIYTGASEEEKSTAVNVILEGVKIKDIMSRDVKTVNSGMSVEELVEIMFKLKHMGYPVVDNEELNGIVTFTDVLKIPKGERRNIKVSQITTQELITTKEDEDAVNALKLMATNNIGRVIVKDVKDDKKMTGIVSRTDILRAVQLLE